jgi:TP901 family phage tail tape measure protein
MPGTYQYDVEIKSNVAKLLSDMKQVQDRLDTVEGKEYKIKLNVDEKKLSSVISNLEKMLDSLGKGTGDFKQFENLSKELSSVVSEVQSLSKAFGKVDDSGAKTLLSSIQNIDKSLSELSQNILNVNKNMSNMGGNTSGVVKQVENISNAYQDAAKEAEKLADAQSKIGQKTNISSASTESVTNSIKEENNVLEQNTQKVKENTQAKEQNANVNLNKYDKRLDSYNGKIDKYKTTIDRFNDGGWTSSTYLENVQAVKNAVKEYETLLNELKGKDASLVTSDDINRLDNYEKKIKDTIATVTNMSASEKGYNFVSGQKELDKIHKLLNENSKMSSEAKAKIKAYYAEIESGNPSMSLDKIHGEILKIYNAEVEAGRAGRTLFDTLKNSGFHQIAAQMAGMVGVYDVINVIKQAASTVTELNTQITELAKVSEQSSKQIYADFDSYADIAKEVRGTISDTIAATADWSKNGYSIPDAKQLAEISQLYKNVGDGIDIDTANESLISTLKGFQLEADQAEHIVDVFNEVSNNEAISSGGIGEALQRSAASFNAASTSLEKSVSLVTATNSVLQNPEKVGNMWRTVSARLRGSETELKEMGEDTDGLVTSTSKLQALVKGITGFDIMKDKDTYKDIYDIVLGIGEKWKDLSDIDRASLLEALAGKQQSNALAAALSNIDILKKSYEEATHAEGSAREENEEYSKSIRASIDLAQAKLEQLANDTLNSNFLKGAIDAGGKLIEVLDGIVKSGNAIPTLLAAIGAGLSFKNIGKCYVSA